MRNDTNLQRIHCSIFEELLLCATYDVKQFYNYYTCHSFVQQCSTQGLLCVRHFTLLSVKMNWYTSWIWFLAS